MIQFPKPLVPGDTLAITAFSSGIEPHHESRFDLIKSHLQSQGFNLRIGRCLFGNHKFVSASKEDRAKELMSFLLDDTVAAVAPPWGGELAIELLPLLDFEALAKARPKWIFGFSDVSTLTATLTAKLGWATAHTPNLMDLVPDQSDALTPFTLARLATTAGENFIQHASSHIYDWPDFENQPLAPLVKGRPTRWQWLNQPEDRDSVQGVLLGGCLDTLCHLVQTDYLNLTKFKAQHGQVIFFLENVELAPADVVRVLHSFDFRGVFTAVDALLLGRNFRKDSGNPEDLTYDEAITEFFSQPRFQQLPIMTQVDFGHVPPNLTLINGAYGKLTLNDQEAFIQQWMGTKPNNLLEKEA